MTVFAPVDASSTYDETVARLGTAIRNGVLPAGSKLPPERELADQLGISRSTLRQALAALTSTGHLSAVRGRLGGTFVSEAPPLVSTVPVPTDLCRLMEWRLAVELGIAQLAAERVTGDDAERLAEAAEAVDLSRDADFAGFRRADVAFHLCLAEIARAPRLMAETLRMHGQLTDVLHHLDAPLEARAAVGEQHAEVSEAVREGDPVRAVAAMRRHLEATEALLPCGEGAQSTRVL